MSSAGPEAAALAQMAGASRPLVEGPGEDRHFTCVACNTLRAAGGVVLSPHRLPRGERCFSRIPDKLIAGIRLRPENFKPGFSLFFF